MVGHELQPNVQTPEPAAEHMDITYQRQDGTVEHAASREEVFAKCPVLGRMAIEAPDEADMLLELAAMGNAKLQADAIKEQVVAPTEEVATKLVQEKLELVPRALIEADKIEADTAPAEVIVAPTVNPLASVVARPATLPEVVLAELHETSELNRQPHPLETAGRVEAITISLPTIDMAPGITPDKIPKTTEILMPIAEILAPSQPTLHEGQPYEDQPSIPETQPKLAVPVEQFTPEYILPLAESPFQLPKIEATINTQISNPELAVEEPQTFEQFKAAQPPAESPISIEKIQQDAPHQKVEQTLVQLIDYFAEMPVIETPNESLTAAIEDLHAAMPKVIVALEQSKNTDTPIELAPEFAMAVITLLQELGYEEPTAVYEDLLERRGPVFVVEFANQLCKTALKTPDFYHKHEFLSSTGKLSVGNDHAVRSRFAKLLLLLLGNVKPDMAAS